MSKVAENVVLETAVKAVPFLDGEYFRGMCEIAAAQKLGKRVYVNANNNGLFESLFHKGIFDRKMMEDGGYVVGNFRVTDNRYLYEYDRVSKTYRAKKEDNYKKFIEILTSINEDTDFVVFETVKPANDLTDLDAILASL